MKVTGAPSRWLIAVTFLTSTSTLFCCALPALFVTLGLGASFAGLVSAAPQLVWLSENKGLLFMVSGGLLALSGLLQWRARNAPCPVDPALRDLCLRARKWGVWVYGISLLIYFVGFSFAYLVPLL